MANDLTFQGKDSIDHHHLKENLNSLSENRYLKRVPLEFRRSVSLEETSIDSNINCRQQSHLNLSLEDPSVNSLCLCLKSHQLLPEFNENIVQSSNEHQFNWWNTIAHLRPLIENIILYEKLKNNFEDDLDKEDKYFIKFIKSKRNGRRNGICLNIDKLYYNQQMILFVAITNQVRIQHNLISSGLKH
jgi:hypothetical protein